MANKKPYPALRRVEHRTHRTVSIRPNAPTARLRLGVNQQRASRFFRLPPELRMRIYGDVFAPYDDEGRRYRTTAVYYRPGYEAHHQTETSPLLACRRIWLEANHLPLELATHTFWFSGGPLDSQRMREAAAAQEREDNEESQLANRTPTEPERFQQVFEKLTPLNFTSLNRVHFFASRAWLELCLFDEVLSKPLCHGRFAAKRLTITFRDADWGLSAQLLPEEVDFGWLDTLLTCPQLGAVKELSLELELRSERYEWLDRVVDRVANKQSRRFKPSSRRHGSVWSRPAVDFFEEGTTYAVVALRWDNTSSIARMQQHRSGARILGGELLDYEPLTKRSARIGRKRGGRRSSAVWYRNHWQDVELTKAAERANSAAELMMEWEREGSLLRLV
ncbi:hypothetical protein LTR65_007781 [Meristemomyces frigidus]